MTLIQVAEEIWCATSSVSPGPGFRMETRMTVVRCPGGDLLVHSPIALNAGDEDAIDELGTVRYLVAPNLFHHFFLAAAKERWPDATVLAPAGLEEKVPALEIDRELAPGRLVDDIEVLAVDGMSKFREHVLFLERSRTLIVTDLIFHRPRGFNFVTRLLFRVFGTYDRLALSRLFKSLIDDKQAFVASLEPICALEPSRVIMAHGEILEENAAQRLRDVLTSSV